MACDKIGRTPRILQLVHVEVVVEVIQGIDVYPTHRRQVIDRYFVVRLQLGAADFDLVEVMPNFGGSPQLQKDANVAAVHVESEVI